MTLVTALLLVGCGSDDGSESTTAGDTGTSTQDTSSTTNDTGGTAQDTGSTTEDTSGPATDTGGAGDAPADAGEPATFTRVWGTIIETKCRSCHSGTTPSGTLNMGTKANAYTNLVGKPAGGFACNGKGTRVVAGNAAMSIMYQKVTTPTCGNRMPAGGAPALPTVETDLIKNWINAGALND
jgi:hypothetical protein